VRWSKWAVVGTAAGKLQDVGLTSEVTWDIEAGGLTREETLSSNQPVSIRLWWMVVPTSYYTVESITVNGVRADRFSAKSGALQVSLQGATFPVSTSIKASGDSPLGRGVHGAIPLHLIFESRNLVVTAGKPLKFRIVLLVVKGGGNETGD